MPNKTGETTLNSVASAGASVCPTLDPPDQISNNLSGIILEQNKRNANLFTDQEKIKNIEQRFSLPENYIRGDNTPHLTGVQFYVDADKGTTFKYRIEYYDDSPSPRPWKSNWIKSINRTGLTSDRLRYVTEHPHDLEVGDIVTIADFETTSLNGAYTVKEISKDNEFVISNSTAISGTIKVGRVAAPPRKSVTIENGITYVRAARIPVKDIESHYVKFKSYNLKTKRWAWQQKTTFKKKIKIPKNAIILYRLSDDPSYNATVSEELFSTTKSARSDTQKSNIKKYKKKNSKIVNYKTFLHVKIEGNFRSKGVMPKSTGFGYVPINKKNLDALIKRGWYRIGRTSTNYQLYGFIEVWVPYKFKKETVSIKWKIDDIDGMVDYYDNDDRYDQPVGWVGLGEGEVSATGDGNQWIDAKFGSLEIPERAVGKQFKLVLSTESAGFKKFYFWDNGKSVYGTAYSENVERPPIMYRILAAVADEGTDFLSNEFRSAVSKHGVETIQTDNTEFWSSKPNPSKYGVETLYFNFDSDGSKVIDSIYLDPITPGVFFNVYYSNDTAGPTDVSNYETWDNLLWTWVPRTFTANKKQSYVFPNPINAKYVKVEFSRLQASYYNPGVHSKPILYKKYPSWVVNYFLQIYNLGYNKTEDPVVSGQTRVTYDALDLAFNYYRGDILNRSTNPVTIDVNNQGKLVVDLLKNAATDLADYDPISLGNINASFDMFRRHPGYQVKSTDTVSSQAALRAIKEYFNYSTETLTIPRARTDLVSTPERDHLMLEKQMPVMYFYPTSRHGYREAYAKFESNKAYFVKIRELRFERNINNVISDKPLYKFIPDNFENAEHSDFVSSSNKWSVS